MFKKRLSEVTADDLAQLKADEVQEGPEIEFKRALPAKDGGRDSWMDGADRIGDKARNELLAEIVAFANAYGGTLLLGIVETTDKPPRAAGIDPVPRCVELAHRLELQCRDCIEPQIPIVESVGIVTDGGDGGVVAVRVPRSRSAPHRLKQTLECYVRRGERTERMTMREIQDLTLNTERGLADIDSRFAGRRAEFEQWASFPRGEAGFAIRATAIPMERMYIDRVFGVDRVRPPLRTFGAMIEKTGRAELRVPVYSRDERPILRGSLADYGEEASGARTVVMCDGTIEYAMRERKQGQQQFGLFPNWVFGLVANAVCAVERFRHAATAPTVEYGLEIELIVAGEPLPVGNFWESNISPSANRIPTGRILFPRYSVDGREELGALMERFHRDFWNAGGIDVDQSIKVNFDRAFSELGIGAPAPKQ